MSNNEDIALRVTAEQVGGSNGRWGYVITYSVIRMPLVRSQPTFGSRAEAIVAGNREVSNVHYNFMRVGIGARKTA